MGKNWNWKYIEVLEVGVLCNITYYALLLNSDESHSNAAIEIGNDLLILYSL